jgi:hypothetical protein
MTDTVDVNRTASTSEGDGKAIIQITAIARSSRTVGAPVAGRPTTTVSREFQIYGGLKEGSPSIKLDRLLRKFIPDIPETDDALEITTLNFSADTANKIYTFEGEVLNLWTVDLGGVTEFKIASLYLFLQRIGRDFGVTISGSVVFLQQTFLLFAERQVGARFWRFSAALDAAKELTLSEIVNEVAGSSVNLEESELTRSLSGFKVSELGFTLDTGPSKRFEFRGAFEWVIEFSTGEKLAIAARLELESFLPPALPGSGQPGGQLGGQPGNPPARVKRQYIGEIGGSVSFEALDADFLKNLSMAAVYRFSPEEKLLTFRLIINEIELFAQFRKKTPLGLPPEQTLVIGFGNTTFGDILNFMVQLVDPNVGDFQLDPPWNELGAISLRGLELEINLTRKIVTFRFPAKANLGFITIDFIGLTYVQRSRYTQKTTVEIELIGSFLGKPRGPNNPLGWDTLNQSPPEVPGQGGTLFDLRYLGLGQRVSFDQATLNRVTNITQIMDVLQERVRPLPGGAAVPPVAPTNPLQFNARSGWLIGAQFTVIDTLEINLIFNDPVLYGIRIGLRGAKAKIFAGLIFEILYRRISDTIGVYHVELVLPDVMRQLQFGAVSVTLPVVVIDIYTNGDFKLDFGFPWRFNFARSFALDVLIFTGAGGFYFNKLSAETATSVPIITNGRFNPVIEFGLGLKVGLGRTVNKGVLKAEISITIQGIIEGVIAWFNPNDPNLPTDQYFRIQGGVAIVGRLWGLVDFAVIQVEVEVIVRIAVLFVVESYKPIFLTLVAEVSVRASVKILFIRVSFSFQLTLKFEFTLGSARPTPWILDPDQSRRRPVTGTGTDTGPGLPGAASVPMAAMRTAQPAAMMVEPPPVSRPAAAPSADTLRTGEPSGGTSPPNSPGGEPSAGGSASAVAGNASAVDTPAATSAPVSGSTAPAGGSPPGSTLSGASSTAARSTTGGTTATPAAPSAPGAPPSDVAAAIATVFTPAESFLSVELAEVSTATVTLLSWQPIAVLPTKVTLNLFFQPAFSRNIEGIQGVALLFIENSIDVNSTGYETYQRDAANNTPFDLLAQVLLTWAIYAYKVPPRGNSNNATPIAISDVTLTDLETLYTLIVNGDDDQRDLFSYATLADFLQANFVLNISDRTSSTSGTIFPMIPQLSMQLGNDTAVRFDAAVFQLSERDRLDFARYFAQLKGSHGSTVEQTSTPIGGAEDESDVPNLDSGFSVASFIFVDYFQLLVRSVVQQAIDYLKDNLLEIIELEDLLNALNAGGQFNHLGAMASRFLLHGLRVPDRRSQSTDLELSEADRADPNRRTHALYRELGQRFRFTAAADGFTITLANPDRLPWISFTDYNTQSPPQKVPSATLRYLLSRQPALIDLIGQLNLPQTLTDIQKPDFLPIAPQILKPYIDQPRRYSLNQRVAWLASVTANQPPGKFSILALPDNLQTFLAVKHQQTRSAQGISPGVNLRLRYGKPAEGRTHLIDSDLRSLTNFSFATRVTLNLRRIPTPDGTALLPTTYLFSSTSEADKDLLEDLWSYLNTTRTTPQLFLLYGAVDRTAQSNVSEVEFQTGLTNALPTRTLLLKTNLSTYSTRPPKLDATRASSLYSATLSEEQGTNWIQLLWEGSTVNTGGYHLRYEVGDQGLPDHLFTDGLTASVVLLVLLKPPAGRTQPLPAQDFHNCVVVREALLDLEESVLLLESDDTVKALSIPAGNLGFRLERPMPQVASNQTGRDELEALYHLLGFKFLETTSFRASNEGLPLGPAEDDPTTTRDDNLWIYERVAPIYPLAKSNDMPDKTALPPARLNPYAGISATAEVAIAFQWRDLYGSLLTAAQRMPQNPKVRYFDPILGINQWPAVVESYLFRRNAQSEVELLLQMVLDQNKYVATAGRTLTETRQSVSAARATYQQIYYQIHQSDHRFSVHTSVIPAWTFPLTEADQKTFKLPLIDFVETAYRYLSTLEMVTAPTHTVSGDTLHSLSALYHVSLNSLSLANADVVGLFPTGTLITVGATTRMTLASDSLRSLATSLQTTLALVATAAQAIVLSPVTLTIPDRVTIPTGLPASVDNVTAMTLNALTGILKTKVAADLSDSNRTVTAASLRFSSTDTSSSTSSTEIQAIAQRIGDCTAVAIANQNRMGLLVAGAELLPDGLTAPLLTEITGFSVTAEEASTSAGIARILNRVTSTNLTDEDWQALLDDPVKRSQVKTIQPNDTFSSIADRFSEAIGKPVAIANIVVLLYNRPGFLTRGQSWIAPPIISSHTINLNQTATAAGQSLNYPNDPLFPVTVQLDTSRDSRKVDAVSRADVPEIEKITGFLSPKTTQLSAAVIGTQEDVASLRGFARDFEAAFPGLHLAVGNELAHKHSTNPQSQDDPEEQVNRPLWAVHFGTSGIKYDINESYPFFFSPAPLANVLLTGTVNLQSYQSGSALPLVAAESKRIEAIDLNIVARDFLVAVEEFLDPAIAIPAAQLKPNRVNDILLAKEKIADAIHTQVTNILAQTDNTDISDRRKIAADALRQKLLLNLVEGFDIETIIQYQVQVQVANVPTGDAKWSFERSPRLVGQPVIRSLYNSETGDPLKTSEFSFALSDAKVPLSPGNSYLTFFFDTKSPEKFENVQLELIFRVDEMEYDITDVPGINSYQASSWLNFILPIEGEPTIDNANTIGRVDIPVPLRTYPMPPSLVLHRAEPDPDSLKVLEKIREWQYTFVYEHVDVAQDDIEATLYKNESPLGSTTDAASVNLSPAQRPLFEALMNFSTVYPQLLPDLNKLLEPNAAASTAAIGSAIEAIATLIQSVANAWQSWRNQSISTPAPSTSADYIIQEETPLDSPTEKRMTIIRSDRSDPFPTLIVPQYSQPNPTPIPPPGSPDTRVVYRFFQKSLEEAQNDPVFGESSIPDYVLSIPDLDVVQQQNAWAAVRLTRNKNLVLLSREPKIYRQTNPAFVFQTPDVRFTNPITPLLINPIRWNVASLNSPDGTAQKRSLTDHLQVMFDTLLPNRAEKPYDLRVACRYAFSLARNAANEDLLSTLPVLLGPRLAIPVGEGGRSPLITQLRDDLAQGIRIWRRDTQPNETGAMFIFSVSLFSNLASDSSDATNLPLLRVDHLAIYLKDIATL